MGSDVRVFLFRHGETVWNAQGRRQGHLDSPLTEKGRQQAINNARRLERHRPLGESVVMFSSPLGRARQTAEILVGEIGLSCQDIIFEPRLMECSFGLWEGLTTSEIKARYPDEWTARTADKWNIPAPSGESYADVHARVSEWFAAADFADTTLVFCHGLTSRVFRGIYADLSQQEIFDLDEPQDGFFELHDRAAVFID
ncbi:MAG: histidine phosphatase family protein [Silicimonas sp.]|jgi:probable phosphoglycerate mutase|nr:histidine phosphatase family protein [Silicimonas sp.]